ncbi:hypothetical protein M885DRAFT_551853 [Pelagophyceae sp. CCMP2097]|nr:hypothetical protein M885DRAFT_551853 [Pelagophyceae sp. CCMP2097]
MAREGGRRRSGAGARDLRAHRLGTPAARRRTRRSARRRGGAVDHLRRGGAARGRGVHGFRPARRRRRRLHRARPGTRRAHRVRRRRRHGCDNRRPHGVPAAAASARGGGAAVGRGAEAAAGSHRGGSAVGREETPRRARGRGRQGRQRLRLRRRRVFEGHANSLLRGSVRRQGLERERPLARPVQDRLCLRHHREAPRVRLDAGARDGRAQEPEDRRRRGLPLLAEQRAARRPLPRDESPPPARPPGLL